MKKQGQLTIFVIIGLVILLTLTFLIFFRQEAVFRIEQVEPEFMPVKDYVEACMQTIAYEGLETQGLNGGYITFPAYMQDNPYTSLNPTGAPGSPYRNPYWWYDGTEAIPTQEFMELQLMNHIETGIANCLNSFEAFKETYNIVELGGFEANVEYGVSDDSIVKIESVFPFMIKDKFNKTLGELKDFKVEIPIRMHRLYKMAKSVMEFANEDPFLERKVIDLIAVADEERMPSTGFEIECATKKWLKSDIDEYLRHLIRTNFGYIKVEGTKYNNERYIPIPNSFSDQDNYNASYYQNHYIWEIPEPDSNMRVSFRYDDKWPMDLKIRPSDGRYLESNAQRGQEAARFLCIQLWHFTYDVVFPVMVSLRDERTSDHEDFTFQFAYMVSIDHNQPARYSFASTDFKGKDTIPNDEYCNNLYYQQSIVAVEDVSGGEEIRDVNFTMKCGKFSCDLGISEPVYVGGLGGQPMFRNLTPYCVQAVLEANKPGFETAKTFINTDKSRTHEIYMSPVTEISNYTILKHKYDGERVYPGLPLDDNETATILIKYPAKNFETYVPYPQDTELPLKLLAKDDFEYELQIYVMRDGELFGGYIQNWTVSEFDIEKGKIIFHIVYMDTQDEEEQYFFFGGLRSYSKEVNEPEFVLK
jgi:hypothetical protein